ncbi:MAG: glycoside hydrolase family 65 protein [Clostridia bacterium]|nr:glycoside hydrolase family 65 protein [Clostridia bacterium]
MNTWILEKEGFSPADAAADGNRFLCANGYLGLRGVPEEAGPALFPAVTLAGVYDQFEEKWREPVNAPHGLRLQLTMNGRALSLEETAPLRHKTMLDYRYGIYHRDTDFGPARILSSRFTSLADPHLMADQYRVEFQKSGLVSLRVGISTDIWDINGPHLFGFRHHAEEILLTEATTGQKGIRVAVAQGMEISPRVEESISVEPDGLYRTLVAEVFPGDIWTLSVYASVYTSLDHPSPAAQARASIQRAMRVGYLELLQAHQAAWDQVWQASEIQLEGDEAAAQALHASQYHLNCIAPRHAGNMSIPARGLSGQTYKGAIFWDSEMFFFPMFVYTQPEVAQSLLRYRIETLPGARKKAAEYGYRGAFYAWESQEGGEEGCTNFNVVDVFTHRPVRTYFRDKQIHISGDIAYALRSYYDITGDRSLLEEGGAEVILECARFYLSRASLHADREEADFADVIGPDEYHERVTNNAYTNQIILHCLQSALALADIFADRPAWFQGLLLQIKYEKDWPLLENICRRLPAPREREGVIEQFDGYFALEDCTLEEVRSRLRDPREYWGGDHGVAGVTQIIKQADVIAMMALFPGLYTDAQVAANWAYYEPRTEHGSSLSACMYALAACRVGRLEEAWQLFQKTAEIDVLGGGKQWAGEIYIGGTHPASNGGAWMIAALGFAGLRMRGGQLTLQPHLPSQVKRLSFPVTAAGRRYRVEVTQEGGTITEI